MDDVLAEVSVFTDIPYYPPESTDQRDLGTATKGSLGSFEVAANSLQAGQGSQRIGIQSDKNNEYFWVGDQQNPNTILGQLRSKTGIDEYGLWTNNGYFTGTVTASAGVIGGWTINASTITGGNVTLDSAGNIRFGKTGFSDTTNAGLIMGLNGATPTFYIGTALDASYMKLTGGVYELVGTISGRSTLTIANSINASGNLITDIINGRLDSSAKKILSDFDFGSSDYAGGVKAGSVTWNTTTGAITGGSGILIYRSGIVGVEAGVVTFTIDATTGAATFGGTLSAPDGTIGGFTISATTLSATNLAITSGAANTANISVGTGSNLGGLNSANASTDVVIWAGATHANRVTAPFRVLADGTVFATRFKNLIDTLDFDGFKTDGMTETAAALGTSITRSFAQTELDGGNNDDEVAILSSANEIWRGIDFSNDHEVYCQARFDATTKQDAFLGLGLFTRVAAADIPDNATSVLRHIGFYLENATLYASNADGTTQTKTSVATISASTWYALSFIYDAGVDIKFYIDGVLVATHTTNLPTGSTDYCLFFGISYDSEGTGGASGKVMRINNKYRVKARQ